MQEGRGARGADTSQLPSPVPGSYAVQGRHGV